MAKHFSDAINEIMPLVVDNDTSTPFIIYRNTNDASGDWFVSYPYPAEDADRFFKSQRELDTHAAMYKGADFDGGSERINLVNGIPAGSRTYVNGSLAAETEYLRGVPLIQKIDLDLDGRMETIRRYGKTPWVVVSSESDWDGDGIYEYAETLQSDGTMKKSWDLNKDGVHETYN
jgi:hypothetical protein